MIIKIQKLTKLPPRLWLENWHYRSSMISADEPNLELFQWSEPFDFEIDETKIIQINNNGCGWYRIYMTDKHHDIYYHQSRKEWVSCHNIWKRGLYFFSEQEQDEKEKVWKWATDKKIFTYYQPHQSGFN